MICLESCDTHFGLKFLKSDEIFYAPFGRIFGQLFSFLWFRLWATCNVMSGMMSRI